jgi:2,4-dienoyl-CoA reductase-like NADH-dependent reductase (Old Yellow Enzyme family)
MPSKKSLIVTRLFEPLILGGVTFAKEPARIGVDVIDCSSGGIGKPYEHPDGYGYQVPYAKQIKREVGISTMAVGLVVDPFQAETIVASGQADLVAIGQQALRAPNFALRAQQALGAVNPQAPFSHWAIQIGWWLNGR